MSMCPSLQTLLDDGHIEFKQNLRKHPEAFNEAASECVFTLTVASGFLPT